MNRLEMKIEKLRIEISELRAARPGRRVRIPAEIKSKIVSLLDSIPAGELGKVLEIPIHTLQRWKRSTATAVDANEQSRFQELNVQLARESEENFQARVLLPNGLRIEGLPHEFLLSLIREGSGG